MTVHVSEFMTLLRSLEGSLYRWGGKGPTRFDCSGLMTWALKHLGGTDLTQTHNAQAIRLEVTPADWEPGLLALYGPPGRADHIMAVDIRDKYFIAYGACGGNQSTVDDATAIKQHAKVQARGMVKYRPDLLLVGKWSRLSY